MTAPDHKQFAARRIAMRVQYDGTGFLGWQRQSRGRTVQEEIERMLSRLAGDVPVTVVGAGRTDSGVHAHGQVAHADIITRYSAAELHHAIGRMSPDDMAITDLADAPAGFHARYAAYARSYRYSIIHHRDPFLARYAWRLDRRLDSDLLNAAAAQLHGAHDFTALSKHNPDTEKMICDISRAEWRRREDGVEFHVTADRFLYGMVRLLVGAQIDVALGRMRAERIGEIIVLRDRSFQSTAAPAHGLSLVEVSYPYPIFRQSGTDAM
ncbi:MAG: tRNA pseudouridine(38-40) synthase TruA [Candidatus Kapaibacterium sp.]